MNQASSHVTDTFEQAGMLLMLGLSLVLFTVVVHAQQSSTTDIPQQQTATTPRRTPAHDELRHYVSLK